MKCFSFLFSFALVACLFPSQSLAQGEYNYLIAAYNYAVAIRHNFEEAEEYYSQYFAEELEKISERMMERVAVELEAHIGDGQGIQACAGVATYSLQAQLTNVYNQFLVLNTEGNKMHQAINEKMMEVNMMELPMDDFYYNFTNRMFVVYLRLNDNILPNLMDEIVALVVLGNEVYQTLDNCLTGIN